MARITITGVNPEHKRKLAIIAAEKSTTISELLRERVRRLVLEGEEAIKTREELADTMARLMDVIVLYQRRRYQEAEELLAEVHSGRLS